MGLPGGQGPGGTSVPGVLQLHSVPMEPPWQVPGQLPSPFLAVKNTLVQCLVYPESVLPVHMYLPTCHLPSTSEEALFLTQLLVWPQGKRP